MKRYIKINSDYYIIDIFGEHVKRKFDGTEIEFDETNSPSNVWINGKGIFDEAGTPIFQYIDNEIIEHENTAALDEYKKKALVAVSERSRQKRSKILDDQTISNISIGATSDYPEYLTVENVALMIEQFKSISREAKSSINEANSKEEIDSILLNIQYPSEAEILEQIQ